MSIVTLVTDFGTGDGFVGEMKGVILTSCPAARVVDITHTVKPGDVASASWILERVWSRFPAGTVHLVVVDPGVGTDRVPLAALVAGRWFVGPDNGLLATTIGPVEEAYRIDARAMEIPPPSMTFHGRDLFAPAAAWLASERTPSGLGAPVEPAALIRYTPPEPVRVGDSVRGEILRTDHFGNLITNIPSGWVAPTALVEIGGEVISGLRTHYEMVEVGELVALIGSGGTLEVSVRSESAAARLGVGRGADVNVRVVRD
jgi:S-adenosylmethionine hydrolase